MLPPPHPGQPSWPLPAPGEREELLEQFDQYLKGYRASIWGSTRSDVHDEDARKIMSEWFINECEQFISWREEQNVSD